VRSNGVDTWTENAASRLGSSEGPRGIRRVLVVDDDPTVRELVSRVLRDAGYDVLEARDGLEALDQLQSARPQIVVLDLTLPFLNGWQVLERASALFDGSAPPFIVVSARLDDDPPRAVPDVAAWFTKPLDLDQFVAAVQDLTDSGSAPPLASGPPAERGRVLIVDDEQMIRDVLHEYFEGEGYVVDAVSRLADAAQCIAAAPPSLILLDLMLPDGSGADLLRERVTDPVLSNIPVVVLSAATRDRLAEARRLGADALISKPFDLNALGDLVESFVG
jgi:DNA-binding response OmpR family regulator